MSEFSSFYTDVNIGGFRAYKYILMHVPCKSTSVYLCVRVRVSVCFCSVRIRKYTYMESSNEGLT